MPDSYDFDFEGTKRIVDTVRRVEQAPQNTPTPQRGGVEQWLAPVHVVQVTGAADGTGLYPANLLYSTDGGLTWLVKEACYCLGPNGETLSNGVKYGGRFYGYKIADGLGIYVVFVTGVGGGSPSPIKILDLQTGPHEADDTNEIIIDLPGIITADSGSVGHTKINFGGINTMLTLVTGGTCGSGTMALTTTNMTIVNGVITGAT